MLVLRIGGGEGAAIWPVSLIVISSGLKKKKIPEIKIQCCSCRIVVFVILL